MCTRGDWCRVLEVSDPRRGVRVRVRGEVRGGRWARGAGRARWATEDVHAGASTGVGGDGSAWRVWGSSPRRR